MTHNLLQRHDLYSCQALTVMKCFLIQIHCLHFCEALTVMKYLLNPDLVINI
jgi:hypothetical protein